MKRLLPLLLLLAGCATTAATPEGAVRRFYEFHLGRDMAFTPRTVDARAGFLAPELRAAIAAYFAKDVPPDEVPVINGDPFTDSQEYPAEFEVGDAEQTGDGARVPVDLKWPDGRTRRVVVIARPVEGRWQIADFVMSDGSSLVGMLR